MFNRLKKLFANPEFHDPQLGLITLDLKLGFWEGRVRHSGRELRFFVTGTVASPDAVLLDHIRGLLTRFAETERIALDYLCSREERLQRASLEFHSFDFLNEHEPDHFAFEFLVDGDDSRVWRVAFVAGQPSQIRLDEY